MRITKMKLARMRAGWSQAYLAAMVGVTQPRISTWENGMADIPQRRQRQIAAALHLAEAELDQDA